MVLVLMPGANILSWNTVIFVSASGLVINFIWDKLSSSNARQWYRSKIKLGNMPFIWYLLILTGFWIVHLQIFVSLNIFIRDYINTGDLITFASALSPGVSDFISGANVSQLIPHVEQLLIEHHGIVSAEAAQQIYFDLTSYSVMIPASEIIQVLQQSTPSDASLIANNCIAQYQQVKPELIGAINFGSIVILQLLVSKITTRFKIFHVLVGGTLLLAASYLLLALAPSMLIAGTTVAAGVLIFSVGEMLVSPKSMEYIAAVMPKEQSAMYQGYLYIATAFGGLIGGLLSGSGYQYFSRSLNKPEYFWFMFAIIGVLSALGLLMYDKFVAHKLEEQIN